MPISNNDLKKGAIIRFTEDCDVYARYTNWFGMNVNYDNYDIVKLTSGMGPDQIPTFDTGQIGYTYDFTHRSSEKFPEVCWTASLRVNRGTAKKGDELIVLESASSSYMCGGNHVRLNHNGKILHVAVESFKQNTELAKVSDECHHVIFDPISKKYLQQLQGLYTDDPDRPDVPGAKRYVYTAIWSDKVGKAKKFKNMGALKGFIINNCGYYTEEEVKASDSLDIPYYKAAMAFSNKVMDFDNSWQALTYNKSTKSLVESLDLKEWWNRTNALKTISKDYGSSARRIVDKVDKKPDGTTHILILRRSYPSFDYDTDKESMEKLIKEIKKLKKGTTSSQELEEVPTFTISIPLTDENEGLMILLSISNYNGWETRVLEIANLQSKVIDLIKAKE